MELYVFHIESHSRFISRSSGSIYQELIPECTYKEEKFHAIVLHQCKMYFHDVEHLNFNLNFLEDEFSNTLIFRCIQKLCHRLSVIIFRE